MKENIVMFPKARIPYGTWGSSFFPAWQTSALAEVNIGQFAGEAMNRILGIRKIPKSELDYLIIGSTVPWHWKFWNAPLVANCLGQRVPGFHIEQACATGLQAVLLAGAEIQSGANDVVGVLTFDRTSDSPVGVFPERRAHQRTMALSDVWDNFGFDPATGQAMITAAGNAARKHGLERKEVEDLAFCRYQQYFEAKASGFLDRILVPLEVLNVQGRSLGSIDAGDLVDRVFGGPDDRGSLVISGANGIVGAGKMMQLTSRLEPFGVRSISLSRPRTADGIGPQYPGLVAAVGKERADRIMGNIVRLTYDGTSLPEDLKRYRPRFLLESIPEILDVKKAHYTIFQEAFPGIEIRSVTSGFPSSQLGVGVAHPAFPHEINKVWEIVEEETSSVTQLLWALGLVPVPVSDDWSFVLDVLFCGLTLAGLKYHRTTNMPFWKIDKYVRKFVGPNPFRAHDVIGAKGADFLTWSCLHHLSENYGPLFRPTPELDERKETGQNWYPLNHFRPLVNWPMDDEAEDEFTSWIQGALFQMASLMLHEQRGHLSHINAIGELCAQFRRGILAMIRSVGAEAAIQRVEAYHRLHPEAAESCWYPAAFEQLGSPEWQQLYVNAEHDGNVGVITISRETYNSDVDVELNRAIDWLNAESIDRVIVSGDFHLATQMIGADTSEFYPALEDVDAGRRIAATWSATARRFYDEFKVSVGFAGGKRCLGGFLELLMHCHYLVAVDDTVLGMPEVTLPVVPGMEACHWPFRKSERSQWPKLVRMLLTGAPAKAKDAVDWLVDYAGPMQDALKMAWSLASGAAASPPMRKLDEGMLKDIPADVGVSASDNPATEAARAAIMAAIRDSCGATLSEALDVQARHSADFSVTSFCKQGSIGAEYTKTMLV